MPVKKQGHIDTAAQHAEGKEQWQKENQEALEALNRFHEEHGCFS